MRSLFLPSFHPSFIVLPSHPPFHPKFPSFCCGFIGTSSAHVPWEVHKPCPKTLPAQTVIPKKLIITGRGKPMPPPGSAPFHGVLAFFCFGGRGPMSTPPCPTVLGTPWNRGFSFLFSTIIRADIELPRKHTQQCSDSS